MDPELIAAIKEYMTKRSSLEGLPPEESNKFSEEFFRAKTGGKFGVADASQYISNNINTDINPRNLTRSAVQGATFGFGDEILGALPEWMGGGETAKAEMRLKDKAFQEKHKVVSALAGMAGGMAVPGLGAWKTLGGAKTLLKTALTGAALGGGAGAATGAGNTEGSVKQRAEAAIRPGLVGAGTGFLIPGFAGSAKASLSPAARSTARLDKAIRRSGGVNQLLTKSQEFANAGRGGEVMLGDLSVPLRQGSDFAATNSEVASEQLGKVAYGRQADASQRILNDVHGVVGNPNADQIVSDLEQSTRQWAGGPKGFEGLRQNNPVMIPQNAKMFGDFLHSPGVKGPWQQAQEVGLIGPLPPAGGPISFEVLQGVKERLDNAADAAFNKGMGDLGKRLGAARDDLVKEMKVSVPKYQEVAAEYHMRKDLERQVQAGRDAFNQADTRGLRQQVSSLNTGQLAKFREGMASDLITKLRNTSTNRDIGKQIVNASPAMQDKIEIVFGSQTAAERFMRQMETEKDMAKMLGALSGSQTARRLAAQGEGVDPLEVGLDVATAPLAPWSAMSRLAGVFRGATRGKMATKTAEEMGPLLSTQGSPAIEKLLREWQKKPPLVGGGIRGMLPVGFGVGAGGLLSGE